MAYAVNAIDWYRQNRTGLVGFGGFNGFLEREPRFGDAATMENRRIVMNSGYWIENAYRQDNPDVVAAGVSPLQHFIEHGGMPGERRNPGGGFSTGYYFDRYPDVAAANVNALIHYMVHGKAEGRIPDAPWGPPPSSAPPPSTPSTTAPTGPSASDQAIAIFNGETMPAAQRAIDAYNAHRAPTALPPAQAAADLVKDPDGPARQRALAGDVAGAQNDAAAVKALADQAEAADRAFVAASTAPPPAVEAPPPPAPVPEVPAAPAVPAQPPTPVYQPGPTTVLVGQPMTPAPASSSSTILLVGAGLAALFLLKK